MTAGSRALGTCDPRFAAVRERLRGAAREPGGARRGGRDHARRPARGRSLGRPRRPGAHAPVDARHAREPLLDDEGHDRALRAPPRRPGQARPRRARRALLARVRAGGQGRDPGALAPRPQRRASSRSTSRCRPSALYDWDAMASALRRAEAVVGAGHRARLPRAELRLARRRADAAHRAAAASARTSATRSPARSAPTSGSARRPSSIRASRRCECRDAEAGRSLARRAHREGEAVRAEGVHEPAARPGRA